MTRAAERAALQAEGIVFDEPRLWMTLRFARFRGPGRAFVRKTKVVRGRLVVTRRRIVARGTLWKVVDLPCTAATAKHVVFTVEGDALRIAVPDVSVVMGPSFSGDFSLTVHTPRAAQMLLYFTSLQEPPAA